MNLNNFEHYIDGIIYIRGRDYFDNGYVDFVKETEKNVFVARVEGTKPYEVDVKLDEKQNIIGTFCDCPYDMGEYCKHQVAVFLALKDMKNQTSDEGQKKKILGDPDIRQVLFERTKEEIIDFLNEIASENNEIKQRIIIEFYEADDDEQEISQAVSLIHTYIRSHSDQYGYINYRNTGGAVHGAELVFEKARDAFDEGMGIHAVNLALCVVRDMVDLIQDADDSNGTIGGVIDNAFNLIDEVVHNVEFNESQKRTVFDCLMKEASQNRYDGWTDWRLKYLEIASEFSDEPELRTRLETQMYVYSKNEGAHTWSDNYFAENVNQIRYKMILRNDGEQNAQEFIARNLRFTSFRKMTIDRAMQNSEYEQVIRLAKEGEAKDINLPGLLNNWKKYRYKAYKLAGKLDEQRELARYFILDGNFEYYLELKNTYAPDKWVEIYPCIISSMENWNARNTNIYTRILIEEGEKGKLLWYVKKNPSSVESHYVHLIPEYTQEVYDIFEEYIKQAANRAGNRRDYQMVCAIIRNLIKAGGIMNATQIKQNLFVQYSKRPAFIDELRRI